MSDTLKHFNNQLSRDNPYKGASDGRRLGNWQPQRLGPNTTVGAGHDKLDARAHDVVRNDPFISKAVNTLASNEIGSGIRTISRADNETFRSRIQELWEEWVPQADPAGVLDYNGLLMMASKARWGVGGCFIRLRRRRQDSGLAVPLQLQMIENAQVPLHHSDFTNQGRIIHGVEFNTVGERTKYHMYETHPFDTSSITTTAPGIRNEVRIVQVPADNIIHHFEPSRPGQVREVPWISAALVKAHDFGKYEDAELIRKTIRAQFTGFITRQEYTENDFLFDPFTGESVDQQWGIPTTNLEPGTLGNLMPGEDIKMLNSDDVPEAFGTYVTQQMRAMAAAIYVPYELLSGDYSEVNDRSLKVILDDFYRFVEVRRNTITIPQICKRVWEAFVDTAVLSGRIRQPADYFTNKKRYIAADFRVSDGRQYPHPVQHREAQKAALDMNLTTLTAEAAKEGKELKDILRQKAEELQLMKEIEQEFGVELVSNEEILKPAAPAPAVERTQPNPQDDQDESNTQ